jgi:hypothetical protein
LLPPPPGSFPVSRACETAPPDNDTYCLAYKIVDGLIRHMSEYADTALAERRSGKILGGGVSGA